MIDLKSFNDLILPILEFLLKVLGGLGALYVFWQGLKRYSKEQTWKRYQFVAERVKEFNSDKMVRNTMLMLDWSARYIELFPDHTNRADRYAKVNHEILQAALLSHTIRKEFTRVEVAIRDNFDWFLNYFEMFDQYVEAGLIDSKDLEPYVKYWINKINHGLDNKLRNSLLGYIKEYEYTGTQRLLSRFGTVGPHVQQVISNESLKEGSNGDQENSVHENIKDLDKA